LRLQEEVTWDLFQEEEPKKEEAKLDLSQEMTNLKNHI